MKGPELVSCIHSFEVKSKIVFIERIFPLYRKAVLDIIYKKHKFLFFHSIGKKSTIKQTKTAYSVIINSFNYSRKESSVFLFVLLKLIFVRPRMIIHEFSAGITSKPLLILFCRLSKTKLIFWGHMYNRSNGFFPGKSWSDKYRLWLWRRADSLITYSQRDKELLINYKIPEEKIFVAFNTVDTNAFLKVRDKLEETGRIELKKRLRFEHGYNLTFIGRLYTKKRPELLLDLLAGLKQRGFKSVAIHYIGGGEMIPVLKEKAIELGFEKDVFFHGPIYDEITTGEMLFCSDLMVMPGCVGLSVNHAFCFNCPVVTFGEVNLDPAHGPEIEYIIDKKTGFLISDHSTETLIKVVAHYLDSTELKETMQVEIKNLIENICSVEKMAEGVVNAIDYNSKKTI